MTQINVRVTPELYDRLTLTQANTGKTQSEIVRLLLDKHLDVKPDDVVPDPGESMDVPEPVRGDPCDVCGALVYVDRKDGLVRVLATREPHTCPVPEPQSLRVAP